MDSTHCADARLVTAATYIRVTHSIAVDLGAYERVHGEPVFVPVLHDPGCTGLLAGPRLVRGDDSGPLVEGEQRAADLAVVSLLLLSRGGACACSPDFGTSAAAAGHCVQQNAVPCPVAEDEALPQH